MSFIALLIAKVLSWVWWFLIPVRKKIAVSQMRRHFSEIPAKELRRTMMLIILQYLYIALGRKATVYYENKPEKGGICICAHGMGWDISLLEFGTQIPISIFLKRPSNSFAARFIENARRRSGLNGLYEGSSMKEAYHALEEGRLVCFVIDQRYNRGITSQFFGEPCLSSPAFAAMHWKSKAPIYTAWPSYHQGQFRVNVGRLDSPKYTSKESCLKDLTQLGQNWVEKQISSSPAEWLWLHKRWKRPPQQ